MLQLDLAIDLRSVLKARNSRILTKVAQFFDSAIARAIFSTDSSTLADHVPFLRCAIHRENVST